MQDSEQYQSLLGPMTDWPPIDTIPLLHLVLPSFIIVFGDWQQILYFVQPPNQLLQSGTRLGPTLIISVGQLPNKIEAVSLQLVISSIGVGFITGGGIAIGWFLMQGLLLKVQ